MKTTKTIEGLNDDFKSASEKLMKLAGNEKVVVSEMNAIDSDFGKAARALMQCSVDNDYTINKLESDFGRTARALKQCSVDPEATDTVKKQLQSDFSKAAVALMQCGVDSPTKLLPKEQEEKLGATVAKLFLDNKKNKNLISDLSKVSKAVMQCSSDF